ncbi:MAG: TetR/AcrR family transcriptional regulator [Methanobacteriaceae archaeon]
MSTKDKIIEATFLLSLKYGFDNVSINQIKEESGITASSIYHHFKNKDDILLCILQKYFLDNLSEHNVDIKNFEGSVITKFEIMFYWLCGIDKINGETIKIDGNTINYMEFYLLFNGIYHHYPEYRSLFHKLIQELIDFVRELVNDSIANNELSSDINSDEVAIYIVTIANGTIDTLSALPEYSSDEIIKYNMKFVKKALNYN